jgi:hypothetical protein
MSITQPTRQMKSSTDACLAFEMDLTFLSFCKVCDLVCEEGLGMFQDTLYDVGHKIPTPELKLILDFITTKGQETKGYQHMLPVDCIIHSHHMANKWPDMSVERIECLLPYMDDIFWINLVGDNAKLRNPKTISPEDFHMVFNVMLDH